MSKSVEELFRDAPPDATHYAGYCHYKKVNDVWMVHMDGDEWDKSSSMYNGDIKPADIVERPQPKPWSGPEDGLPPVGGRVEVLWSSITGQYVDGIILAHDEDRAVFRFVTGERKGEYQSDKLHFSGVKLWPNFRPIKTAEQIASDKRETAIRELMDIAQVDCRVTPARLVDAGFKREVV